ncbi:MAG: reverse transcriptase-like protein [Peptococcaceae bacterium]|nr:reverse transcriptase-like protein [Peptococcaceae bacterium]
MIRINCDGLCEPVNPGGTACYGWVAYLSKEKMAEDCGVICSGPEATNNLAEYTAIIKALEWLWENGLTGEKIELRSDSKLCIYQLLGKYAVRSSRIEPLYSRAKALAVKFRKLRFRWVPRENNKEADALTRRAYASLAGVRMLERAGELTGRVVPLGGGKYLVPSASGRGNYTVDTKAPSCDCPYFTKRGHKCKHILAAEITFGNVFQSDTYTLQRGCAT